MSGETECQLSVVELAKCVVALNATLLHFKSGNFFQDLSRYPRWHLEICTARYCASRALNADEPLPLSSERFDEVLSDVVAALRERSNVPGKKTA